VTDPKGTQAPVESAPDEPLDETTPPMELQQKSLKPSDLEPLDQTIPEMREFLGSEDRPRHRS
jgi:hypothetical protein